MSRIPTALRILGLQQIALLGFCGLCVAFDWVVSRCASSLLSAAGRQGSTLRREAFRDRAIGRLVATLGTLKGAYVKAGQFASVRHDLLPQSVTRSLARLRDQVPPLPFAEIRAAVESELGAPLSVHFAEFERECMGAASIAQVHRARLHSGEEVAVKVQYPWLTASLGTDLRILRALIYLGFWLTGSKRRPSNRRFLNEFETSLAEELDFVREAAVATEIASNLGGNAQVRVPTVVASHSTRRVLTMSYWPAVRIDDREALAKLGVSPRAVLEIVTRAYAKQVFVDGLFHADPHPGNLFVLDDENAASRPTVLFIDFGLSRRLDPLLRRELRNAVHALVLRDEGAFTTALDQLGAIAPGAHENVRSAIASMQKELTSRGGALGLQGNQVLQLKDIAKSLLQKTDGLQLPVDLLLYAKTLSYVFALGAELDPEVDLMKLSLPYLLEFLGTNSSSITTTPTSIPAIE